MRQILLYIVALLAIAGCSKEVTYNTTLVLRPTQQLESSGKAIELPGVVAYAFAADTTEFTVTSYEMALSGKMVAKSGGEKIEAIATSAPYENDIYGFMNSVALAINAGEGYIAIVAVDTLNEDYGYTIYELNPNLPTTYMAVNFAPWKEGAFKYGNWWFVVDDPYVHNPETPDVEVPTPEVTPEPTPNPEVTPEPELPTEPETTPEQAE